MGPFIGFLVFVFIVLLCIVLSKYNKLVKLRNAVKQARSKHSKSICSSWRECIKTNYWIKNTIYEYKRYCYWSGIK